MLRRAEDAGELRLIDAALALTELGGLGLLKAKRAVETVIETGEAALILPAVPDKVALHDRIAAAGLTLLFSAPPATVMLKTLRRRLNMTQEQFAATYGVDIRTLQNYESGRSNPDQGVLAYLQLIEKAPEQAKNLRLGLA